jgi:hypothetical protein
VSGRGAAAGALAAVVGCLAVAAPSPARAATREVVYTVSIGENEIPRSVPAADTEGLKALRYADDDAAAFHSFMSGMSRRALLLSVLDAETQRRFPELVAAARVPSLAELKQVVASLRQAMEEDLAAGREPVLVLFYSGHGVRDRDGAPGLALFDGVLGQAALYDDVLARLPARFVHLIVDACHAEAVVRPRDAEAEVEALAPGEQEAYLRAATLARFPHVGSLLASSAGAESFEWEAYRGGVFAHEVLSGLRGGADVNGDGRVEYSELAAFLAAANTQIADPQVRPQIVVQPPRTDRHAPIVELAALGGHFRLGGRALARWSGPFHVETESGVRLLDVNPERGAQIAYRLPAGVRLFVVWGDREAEIPPTGGGGEVAVEGLVQRPLRARARGAAQTSMRKGLFATAFGPGFYRGYVSREGDLVPVLFAPEAAGPDIEPMLPTLPTSPISPTSAPLLSARPAARDGARAAGQVLLAGAGAAAVASGVLAVLAWNAEARYEATTFEKPAAEERARFERYRGLAWGFAAGAGVAGAAAAALLLWPRAHNEGHGLDGVALTPDGLLAIGRF